MVPLVGRPGDPPPPRPVVWLGTRIHPALRRRNRTAARVLAERPWRARTHEWRTTLRPTLRRANLALQAEELADIAADALSDHLRRVHQHMVEGHVLHFDLHGDDMGPLGLFLAASRAWGIDPGAGVAALTGHSPSTTGAVDALRRVAAAVASSDADRAGRPTTLDGLRALGPDVVAALEEYLDEYGWRVVTGYDLDAKVVGELPEVLVSNVLSLVPGGATATPATGDAAAAVARAQVPVGERARFDDLLGEARTALDLRDDNGPMTVEWPVGLLRRALLEVGRRAVASGHLVDAEHAVELTLDEAYALLRGEPGPGAGSILDRAADRAAAAATVPPPWLGAARRLPPLSAFPTPLATITDMALTCVSLLERTAVAPLEASEPERRGFGVGEVMYSGRARVARTAGEAVARLEPGEVLVVPFTTPAYSSVLGIAGGLVTEEGGVLSHAALLARELGLPSVIGVPGAVGSITDGDQVEVDPVAGTVRIVTPA
jgi:phosphohistidine swiveling domain-containing protein